MASRLVPRTCSPRLASHPCTDPVRRRFSYFKSFLGLGHDPRQRRRSVCAGGSISGKWRYREERVKDAEGLEQWDPRSEPPPHRAGEPGQRFSLGASSWALRPLAPLPMPATAAAAAAAAAAAVLMVAEPTFAAESVAGIASLAHSSLSALATDASAAQLSASIAEPSDFQTGLVQSFLLVLFSEIGDKTFFIAAILASRRPVLEVFSGTFGALGVMTVVSVVLGRALHVLDELIPVRLGTAEIPLDDAAAAVLLVYFGLTTIRDAAQMGDEGGSGSEEEQEAARAVESLQPLSLKGLDGTGDGSAAGERGQAQGGEAGAVEGALPGTQAISLPILASVFTLVFLAEWGDKSFFSTIALAAASSPLGVVAGAVTAHALATVVAVLGGSLLSKYVSEKFVAYMGGILFLAFAAGTVFEIIDKTAL